MRAGPRGNPERGSRADHALAPEHALEISADHALAPTHAFWISADHVLPPMHAF